MKQKPRLKLSHHVVTLENGDLCIGELPSTSLIVRKPTPTFLAVLDCLDGDWTVPRIETHIRHHFPQSGSAKEIVERHINTLEQFNLLEDAAVRSTSLSSEELELYDRQMLFYSQVDEQRIPKHMYQERLKSTTAAVFGLGGWGTWSTLHLALNGFGKVRLVDGDHVELSNLNRQVLYRPEHVGQSKASAAADAVSRMNPHVEVEAVEEFVTADEQQIARLLDGVNILFLAWVNFSPFCRHSVAEVVHRAAFERGIPIVEFGGDPADLYVGPIFLNDRKSPCLCCVKDAMRKEWYSSEQAGIPQFRKARIAEQYRDGRRHVNAWQSSPSLGVMAGLAVDQAIKVCTGFATPALVGKRVYLSLSSFEYRTLDFERRVDCDWCGSQKASSTSEGCEVSQA